MKKTLNSMLVLVLGLSTLSNFAMKSPKSFQMPVLSEKQKVIAATVYAAVLLAISIHGEAKLRKETNNLRKELSGYSESALRFAAVAKLYGLRKLIQQIAFENIAKLRNPMKEIRLLSTDQQIVNAVAFATGKSPAEVQNVLANPTVLQVIRPFRI